MKQCTCYALRAVDCTCLPAKYDEIYEIYTTPEQEPVAWLHTKIEGVAVPHRPSDLNKHPERWEALYKTPQRTWVGLTDEDYIKALELADFDKVAAFEFFENKLKELNT